MSTKQVEKLEQEIEIPEGVEVTLKKNMLQVKGKLGNTYKNFKKIPVHLEVADGKVKLKAAGTRKKDYAILNTVKSIICIHKSIYNSHFYKLWSSAYNMNNFHLTNPLKIFANCSSASFFAFL